MSIKAILLVAINNAGDLSAAEWLGLTKAKTGQDNKKISVSIAGLRKDGLVKRSDGNQKQRQGACYKITPMGRQWIKDNPPNQEPLTDKDLVLRAIVENPMSSGLQIYDHIKDRNEISFGDYQAILTRLKGKQLIRFNQDTGFELTDKGREHVGNLPGDTMKAPGNRSNSTDIDAVHKKVDSKKSTAAATKEPEQADKQKIVVPGLDQSGERLSVDVEPFDTVLTPANEAQQSPDQNKQEPMATVSGTGEGHALPPITEPLEERIDDCLKHGIISREEAINHYGTMPDTETRTKLKAIVDLAQHQIDSIATLQPPTIKSASAFIEIRNTAQELLQ
jgi:DNA-binding PadR family transcriptional regulator